MDKRIKILHIFTIIAIAIFCMTQCWWLYIRYNYTLNNYMNDLYKQVLDIMQEELEIRQTSKDQQDIGIVKNMQINANMDRKYNSLTWAFDVYVTDATKYPSNDTSDAKRIINLYKNSKPDGIKKYSFTVSNLKKERDAYKALERFCIDEQHPFSVNQLVELLEKHDLRAESITMEKRDTMVWNPEQIQHMSVQKPSMIVRYPYDIFDGEIVCMNFNIGISPIIKKMSGTLIITIFLSIMLCSCLIVQILTIRKQRKIEVLRKDFIYTMIHELKRPISTLKMCVSFMKNDKLMQDRESKEAIISDSYNELNNLSSYFSKLRDLTFDDISEIPLSISTFSLEEVVNECIAKLNIPGDKLAKIDIKAKQEIFITADRMHISNIISNLLENAVKYSETKVNVEVGYESIDNTVKITVKDNGIGIPKSEIKYIFDKFYRGSAALYRDKPGLGLGLAYVKLLVNAHNGTIEVKSEVGLGSIFIINLAKNRQI